MRGRPEKLSQLSAGGARDWKGSEADVLDDGSVDESRDRFDRRMQECDGMDRCVAAGEQRRAGEALAARLRRRAARIAVQPQMRCSCGPAPELRDDQRQRERDVNELLCPDVQRPALGYRPRHS